MLNEVVNDKEHRSVRDLVAMMEQNTRSESINPYVRKWGCDLISHEPHRKNVTLRTEKRQIVDQNELNRSLERHHQQQQQQQQQQQVRFQSHQGSQLSHQYHHFQQNQQQVKTFTWREDDLFKRKNKIEASDQQQEKIIAHQANHHSPSGRDDHDVLDAHTAEMEDLLGRRPSFDHERSVVIWPPPSPLPPQDQNSYPSPMFSPSPPPPLAVPLPPSTPSPVPTIEMAPGPMPKKSNLKKRSQSEGARRFSNSSLHEIDQQIVMIQNEFEAELDTLIDTYRHIQQSNKKRG